MTADYTYDKATHFPNGLVTSDLKAQVDADTRILPGLVKISEPAGVPTLTFKSSLSAQEKLDLDDAVATYVYVEPSNEVPTKPALLVGERASFLDGCATPEITSGWARASFPLMQDAHVAFAHAQPFGCLPGDKAQTVTIHPGARKTLGAAIAQGSASFDCTGQEAFFTACVAEGYVEVWDGTGDTAELLCALKLSGVSGSVASFAANTPIEIPSGAQLVGVLKSYSPLRGALGLEGAARFVGTIGTKLGNPGEVSLPVPAGIEIGVRFFAITKAVRSAAAMALTVMLREVLS